MTMANRNYRGHTLVELLIAMTLSALIIIAIIPINSLSLKATQHQQLISGAINQLSQSLRQFESDIKSVTLTGCLLDKANIRDLLFTQSLSVNNQLSHPWLAGNQSGNWHPQTPFFNSSNISDQSDAIHLMFAVLTDKLDSGDLNSSPLRVFYITNCSTSEITRGMNSTLSNVSNSLIYPLQSIIYYVRELDEKLILYRQYLNANGNPRNEPLIDNLKNLKIGYGEVTSADTLIFKTANNVDNWNNIIAVYVQLKISVDDNFYSLSRLIELPDIHE